MKSPKKTYSLTLQRGLLAATVVMLPATPVAAQSTNESIPRVSFKVGAAPALNPDRQKRRASALISLEYSHPFWKGEFFVAGEWRDFVAISHETTPFSPFDWGEAGTNGRQVEYKQRTGYAPNGQTGYITAFIRNPTSAPRPYMIASDMRFDSVDIRKAQLDGVTAKLAYRYRTEPLPFIGSIGIQGGLTLSYLSSWEHADGSIHVLNDRYFSQNGANTSTYPNEVPAGMLDVLSNEYFTEQEKRTELKPGFFIGVRKLLPGDIFFEINLAMLGHTDVEYVPYSYSGKGTVSPSGVVRGEFATSNKTKTVVEFIAGMRF